MRIDSYTYGLMIIDGKSYNKDLIIFRDRIKPEWWRKEGHFLNIEDLTEVIAAEPELLIVGTGESGFMRVPLFTRISFKEKNIDLIARKTGEAAQLFNERFNMGKNVVGAFHLTC